MRNTIHLLILCLIAINAQGQRGARVGLLMGVSNTRIVNADDKNADKQFLKTVPSFGYSVGAEMAYHWRFVNMGFQLTQSQNNQSYALGTNYAKTRLNYLRPTALIGFNSNMHSRTRFFAQFGAAFGFLTGYKDYQSGENPYTNSLYHYEFNNTNFTLTDTGTTTGTVGSGIYYKRDITAVANIGTEIQLNKRWVMSITARLDYGLENLENYGKTELIITSRTPELKNVAYEHWRYTPYKYETDYFYNGVRKPSHNLAIGGFFSFKYSIPSKRILDIEMDEF